MSKSVTNAQILEALGVISERLDKVEKRGSRNYDDDELQPIFMNESKAGNEYAGGKLMLTEEILEVAAENGGYIWVNIFPNKYRDSKHPSRPAYRVRVNPYTPKEDSDES